jgi:hypothetical protein
MAVPPTRLDALLVALSRHDVHVRAVIGEVMELDAAGEIAVV